MGVPLLSIKIASITASASFSTSFYSAISPPPEMGTPLQATPRDGGREDAPPLVFPQVPLPDFDTMPAVKIALSPFCLTARQRTQGTQTVTSRHWHNMC